MRIPVDWINEYVPNELSLKQLAETLTDVGLEVEAVEEAGGAAVLDIKVTPNRGDCLSVVGIARELAMALGKPMAGQASSCPAETGPPASSLAAVILKDRRLCPRYSARIARNVKVAPSPAWAQHRLERCGLRPINNIVDATNLVMLELGQPLHAFDYQLLLGRRPSEIPAPPLRSGWGEAEQSRSPTIIVRRAKAGERLVTIDGVERTLTPEVLVIADPSGPIALAGIMGGASTEIHDGTTEVLLESAHFDPRTVRRGARALGMITEASFRFERAVDPGGTVRALDGACELIAEFCAAPVEIAQGVVDAYPKPARETVISLRPKRANALLGLELSPEEMADHLRRLELEVQVKRTLRVTVPTFRPDLEQEIDLIEEVARAHGYQHIPEALPASAAGVGALCPELAFERQVRGLLRGLGLSEAVTSDLESPDDLSASGGLGLPADHALRQAVLVSNPKTADRSQLRTTLLTSLLAVVARNHRQGVTEVSICDLGRVHIAGDRDGLPQEAQHLGIACTGLRDRGRWAASPGSETWDFYALKGIVENLLEALAGTPGEFSPDSHPALCPGRTARVSVGADSIGILGEVRPEVRAAYDLPNPVFAAELDLDLLRRLASEPHYRPVGRFPAMSRDIAFLLPRDLPARRAESVIREAAGEDLESLTLFDAYEGPPLPEGQRNLAFSLTFRRADRTLTDEEIEQTMNRIRAGLRDQLGARIRE